MWQLHANLCSSLINKCPNHLYIVFKNSINFDLNIFGPLPVIGAGSTPEYYGRPLHNANDICIITTTTTTTGR